MFAGGRSGVCSSRLWTGVRLCLELWWEFCSDGGGGGDGGGWFKVPGSCCY